MFYAWANGTVKEFDRRSGTGYIVPDDGGRDAKFHAEVVDEDGYISFYGGEPVIFSAVALENGLLRATFVRRRRSV